MAVELYQDAVGMYQVFSFCGTQIGTNEQVVIYRNMQGRYFTATVKEFESMGMKHLGTVNLY